MPPGISELTPLNVNYKKKTPPNFFRKISFQWLFTGQNIIFSKDMSNNMRILFMNLSKFLYSKCHVLILWFFPKCKSYNPNMVRSQLRHLLAYVLWLDNLYLELLSHFCHVCSMVLDSEKLDLHIEHLHPNNDFFPWPVWWKCWCGEDTRFRKTRSPCWNTQRITVWWKCWCGEDTLSQKLLRRSHSKNLYKLLIL